MTKLNIRLILTTIALLTLLTENYAQNQDRKTVQTKKIEKNGVYGQLFFKEGSKNLPTVIVVSGSGGGIDYPNKFGEPLAKKGFAVLALPYWKYKDLPDKLSKIPLEYFYNAIEILKKENSVDKSKIGIIGYSRGGELALLLASRSIDIKAVVGLSPGAYVAPNIDFKNWWDLRSAWTENGNELPFLPEKRAIERGNWNKVFEQIKKRRNRDSLIVDFKNIKNKPSFEESVIKVENINAPLLLISGGKDLTWSSESMCDYIIDRLHSNRFEYFNTHLNFPLAGHDFVTLGFEKNADIEDLTKKYIEADYKPGGTIKDNLRAGMISWKFLVEFLELNLKK